MFACGGKDAKTEASPDVKSDVNPVIENIEDRSIENGFINLIE